MSRLLARVSIIAFSGFIIIVCASVVSAKPSIAVTDPRISEPPAASAVVPLEELLRPDGSLDLHGHRGNIAMAGWRMGTEANGAPFFEREKGAQDGPQQSAVGPMTGSNLDHCWDERFHDGVDDLVYALAVDGSGNLYVGGAFTTAGGVSASHVAKWNGASWSALGVGMNGIVRAVALDGSGDLYAGGDFTTAGGVSANYVAKWNGASWSGLGAGMNGVVRALAVDGGGSLYAGGAFTFAGGGLVRHVAKWNGTSWSPLAEGTDNDVYALAVDGSSLYAGGLFTLAGDQPAKHIARWNGTSWSALGGPPFSGGGLDAEVYALAADGMGNIYAGGAFGTFSGDVLFHIAKWNGTSWSALGGGMSTDVLALAVDGGGNLYAGGLFTSAGGVTVAHIAKWNGTSWSALGGTSGINDYVFALAVDSSGRLYAGGAFTMAGPLSVGAPAAHVARWDGTGSSALGAGPNFLVFALAADGGGNLYAGGAFTTAGGMSANHVAKWDGTSWSALGAGVNDYVQTLAVDGSDVYAGGSFTTAGGVSANRIARWNGTNWLTLSTGMNADVKSLAVDGSGNVYAGGSFTIAGGVSVNRIARWNGANWSGLGAGIDADARALALDDSGNLYVGGEFTVAGGTTARYVAKWDGTIWSALGEGMNDDVVALAVDGGGNLYAAGSFTTAGGTAANFIAKWNGMSWSALGGVDPYVYALAVDDSGNLYAGGSFHAIAGVGVVNNVARWNGTSWSALGGGTNDLVLALAAGGGDTISAGGFFTTAGNKKSYYVGQLHPLREYYYDGDGDGYGRTALSLFDCSAPAGYVAGNTDCDDSNPAVHPGAVDACNGIDDNCDGRVDERAQAPGLIGWWKGEDNAHDAAGINGGTPRNGATFVGGRVGRCFYLDGIDDYIDDLGTASTFAFIENTGVFTIEGWVGMGDPNAPRDQTFAASINIAEDKGFYFGMAHSGGGQHALQMALGKGVSGNLIIDARTPTGLITDSNWHHVAATGDGTHVTLYVDGVAHLASGTMGTKSSGDATRAVDIGWDSFGSYYGGQLDELAIYNRALSATEIQAIYNAGSAGRCAVVGVDDPRPAVRAFEFAAPWPNPTAREAKIGFSLPSAAHVRVDVFDIAGRRVLSLIDGEYLSPGEHRVTWDGGDAAGRRVTPGIYEVRIATGATAGVRRIVMID